MQSGDGRNRRAPARHVRRARSACSPLVSRTRSASSEAHPAAVADAGRRYYRQSWVNGRNSVSIKAVTCMILASGMATAETWRGLVVAPEHRCSTYDSGDYSYPQSVEARIVAEIGKIYGPYSGRCFSSTSETDIEHIVARSEAHDSGLCRADIETRRRFARDLANLTLSAPGLNRHEKGAKDAGAWLPAKNRCWFASRVVNVRRKYGLTVDRREADALEQVLADCGSTEMVVTRCEASPGRVPSTARESGGDPLQMYDDNGNGRITCSEARKHGIAPVPRGHPAYRYMRDGDGDGVVCE